MKSKWIALAGLFAGIGGLVFYFMPETVQAAQMKYDEVIFPAPENPAPHQLIMAAEWRIAVPENVKTLRGVVIHQHGCGEGSCDSGRTGAYDLHWQALAAKYDCALLAVSYRQGDIACENWCDPRRGSAQSLFDALDHFAETTGHPELTVIPWVLWGHSGGGHWCGSMAQLYPERVAAAWLRSGHPDCVVKMYDELPMNDAVKQVPMMLNLGAKETDFEIVWARGWDYYQKIRSCGAKIGVMVDPSTHHETGNSRYPAIRFLDICMEQRLPLEAGSTELRPMQTETVLKPEELIDENYRSYVQDGIWLPNDDFADVWRRYSLDCTFGDTTPPPAPYEARIDAEGKITWQCDADLESGLAGFVFYKDGTEIGRTESAPVVNGRPLFQGMSYSDTPAEPVPVMEWNVPEEEFSPSAVYSIRAMNTAELLSEPCGAAAL